jgi:hypothetical protein
LASGMRTLKSAVAGITIAIVKIAPTIAVVKMLRIRVFKLLLLLGGLWRGSGGEPGFTRKPSRAGGRTQSGCRDS